MSIPQGKINRIKEIGNGAFGVVYLVKDETGASFAMKTLEPQQHIVKAVGLPHLQKRFEREIKYQSSIDHPNVVRILHEGMKESPPFFVMELADGTLQEEIVADRTLGGNPRKPLFDILAGLETLHERGCVHRDLKPSNVLRFNGGTEPRYAISDFGLITASQSDSSTLTATSAQGGTPLYAAPELIADFKRATASSDVYSFGAILHDIFGGGATRIPYTELTVMGAIKPIVEKCTKRLPIRRYSTIAELRADLYKVLDTAVVDFNSTREKEIIELLAEGRSLTESEWDNVFLLMDENQRNGVTNGNVFKIISIQHVEQLRHESPELLAALGGDFCSFVQNGRGSFDYDYCDVLAGKLEAIYSGGAISLQAGVLLALLVMGVDHNRWFVEHKFIKLAGADMNENLALRFKTELEVQEVNFERLVAHVERSIGVSRARLHPILQDMLREKN